MDDSGWTCPHCGGRAFEASTVDDRVGRCESCHFCFPHHTVQIDGSTWREQAELFEDAAESMPIVRPDRYRIIRPLAVGAQGRILLAHHQHLDQVCVIKVLDANEKRLDIATARLQGEARAGVLVSHKNLARVLDCDCVEGAWYCVMEYVAGENLRQVVKAVGRLCWAQVVDLAAQTAGGLAAIHSAGLIHRDVKPSNLMLRCDGEVKITDLGLVKWSVPNGDMELTHAGQMVGTPFYMAPEQFGTDEEITPQADIYALGATMYHLLVGRPPHHGTNVVELANKHKHDPVVWPEEIASAVPNWLRQVVETCLSKRPDHRFESGDALRETLRTGRDVSTLLPHADQEAVGVVITPFRNLSRDPADEWIGEGVAEYLSNRLMEVGGLHVADHHGFQKLLREHGIGVGETVDDVYLLRVARMVGAGTVVVGSFQRNGGQVRLTARSISGGGPAAPKVLANASGSVEDLFALEDQLAEQIVAALGDELVPSRRGSHNASGTENLEAHEKFVRGRRAFADGDYHAAVALAEEALAIDPEYADSVGLAGACYARIGDYDRAVEYHERQETAARRDGNQRQLAEALDNLGVMYYYKGEYPLAHEFLEQAQTISHEGRFYPDAAKYDGNLGFVMMRLNRYSEAEEAFARAIDIHKRYGDLVSLAGPYNGMGGVLLKQQRYAEASEYYRRALALANEIGDRVNIGISHMNLGRCACLLGDFARAEAQFDEALENLNGTDFWNGLTLVYEHMADMYIQEGNAAQAVRAVNQRLELAQKHHNNRMEAEAWEQKAKIQEVAGETDEAITCLKRSIEVSQRPAPYESLHHHLEELTKRKPFG